MANGDLVQEMDTLKCQHGGAGVVSALVERGLIDEFPLFVNPTAPGSGLPIFSQLHAKRPLNLVNATPFACGIVVLHFEPLHQRQLTGLSHRAST